MGYISDNDPLICPLDPKYLLYSITVSGFFMTKMVEYLSTIGTKTAQTSRRTLRLVSTLRKLRIPILIVALISIVLLIGVWAQSGISSKPQAEINQEFSVQARTSEKIRVRDADLTVTLTDADIDNVLLIQGKRATTREGKTFLIINMEVENKFEVPLYIFPIDLLRLVREDGKPIAPSVHQGTVEIRPVSVKKSNVGFVINPDEKAFRIEVGDVSSEKQILEISFK